MDNQGLKLILKTIPRLILGLFLCSVAIMLMIYADLGLAPWDVLHTGLMAQTGLTLGQISQGVGLILIVANCFLGEIPGIATLCNMYFIGLFIDLIENTGLLFIPQALLGKAGFLLLGFIIFGWGSLFYMDSNLGAGPRDGLMIALVKKTKASVFLIRTAIEVSALIFGIFLGGNVGIGTVIISLTIGYFVQLAFKLGGYQPGTAPQRTLVDEYRILKKLLNKPTKPDSQAS